MCPRSACAPACAPPQILCCRSIVRFHCDVLALICVCSRLLSMQVSKVCYKHQKLLCPCPGLQEKPEGIIVQFGGQTPLKIATTLETYLNENKIPTASGKRGRERERERERENSPSAVYFHQGSVLVRKSVSFLQMEAVGKKVRNMLVISTTKLSWSCKKPLCTGN